MFNIVHDVVHARRAHPCWHIVKMHRKTPEYPALKQPLKRIYYVITYVPAQDIIYVEIMTIIA
jgi:hypothetical protein